MKILSIFTNRDRRLVFVGSAFLVLGNLPRMIPGIGGGSLNPGELLWIAFALTFGFRLIPSAMKIAFIPIFCLATIASLMVGIIKFGWEPIPFAYNARLILQVVSGGILGISIWRNYGTRLDILQRRVVSMYAILAIISFLLLAAFPSSADLWNLMQETGTDYRGDPHNGRLISSYFDPNFYACIVAFPVMIACTMTKSWKHSWIWLAVLISSLALTFSRSGIALLALMISVSSIVFWKKIFQSRFSMNLVIGIYAAAIVAVAAGLTMYPVLERVTSRFGNVESDDSAMSRLNSLQIGNDLIAQNPIFGFGYNYVLEPARQLRGGQVGLDSSIQVFFASYGIIIGFIIALSAAYWWIYLNRKTKREHRQFFLIFSTYIALSILWSGNFNQIVFYPFWIVPTIAIFTYMTLLARHQPTTSTSEL